MQDTVGGPAFFIVSALRGDLRVGAVLREQNALPTEETTTNILTAKDAINNGGAGRAAKGANPLLCARKYKGFSYFG
jgi:hypothetical protein